MGGTSTPLKIVGLSETSSLLVAPATAPALMGVLVCIDKASLALLGCGGGGASGRASMGDKAVRVRRAVEMNERILKGL